MQTLKRFLDKQCHMIDYVPREHYNKKSKYGEEAAAYLYSNYERNSIKDKYNRIILKLMSCYQIAFFDGGEEKKLTPKQAVLIMEKYMSYDFGMLDILVPECDTLIRLDIVLGIIFVFNADEKMCNLIDCIAESEGLFFFEEVIE